MQLVASADPILLQLVLHLLCWQCASVCAGGGALDVGSTYQQSGSTPGTSSSSKAATFSTSISDGLGKAVVHEGTESCNDDLACITMASNDRLGLEAIKSLHSQLDDDANGNIDLSESDDFLREELQYEAGYERRQRAFHHNDDMHISVRELWEAWLRSEVHNWTIEQTSEWLSTNVELPQYVNTFIQHRVTGATLPRLAVNNMHYVSNVLGIKDPIHKQKIALKAMDVVLFGPPKDTGHSIKDLILITLLFGALIGCWYAYQQKKSSQKDLYRMMKDMESLHKAELELKSLQKEFEIVKMEQESATTEKQNLEKRLRDESMGLHASSSDLEVSQLKAEIEMLKLELQRAEGELEDRCWSPPVGLQHWLQLTHEIENKAYMKKKISAEKQLQSAREACEKLRKKRSSLVGAFVSTHGKSIDEVDKSIVEARTALNEVTAELQERVHRWKQIELLCGFNIINNNGLSYLENMLYRGAPNGRNLGFRGRLSSQDDLDDDVSSLYTPSISGAAGIPENLPWKESSIPLDSSSSETGKDTPPETVHFTLGDGPDDVGGISSTFVMSTPTTVISPASVSATLTSSMTIMPRQLSTFDRIPEDKMLSGNIIRSYSQDANLALHEDKQATMGGIPTTTTSSFLTKISNSENSLETVPSMEKLGRFGSLKKSLRELPTVMSVDEETLSTDSNSTADNDELKRRRRKLQFPAFRKNKNKPS
ncbi:PREDICTED: stromal interaction molecule homolog isoform X2 [Ceratosolen solmsi marchali]|uniref:Stromal interaction molecule homolog isoform X2 n=1 Tax=Ceratosolen solmsi marchali TaxID=326594 RepID=A0AAJ7DZA6_9HYME|nr:PREDICTED: stromal interaction molecule homolog isoform X2 [Ceratosolen solmsi marchali]